MLRASFFALGHDEKRRSCSLRGWNIQSFPVLFSFSFILSFSLLSICGSFLFAVHNSPVAPAVDEIRVQKSAPFQTRRLQKWYDWSQMDRTALIHVGVSHNHLGVKRFAFSSLDKSNIPDIVCSFRQLLDTPTIWHRLEVRHGCGGFGGIRRGWFCVPA